MTDQPSTPMPVAERPPRASHVAFGPILVGLLAAAHAGAQETPVPIGPTLIEPSPRREFPPPAPVPAIPPGRPSGLPSASPLPNEGGPAEGLINAVAGPSAEIDVVIGRSRLVEATRPITRVVIANPSVADVQLLDADKADPRLLNLYGRLFGTTDLTLWDDRDRPISYLIRVTVDTADLEARLRTIFPGAEVKVRQVGPQIILEGQVPDSKTMAEVLQLVNSEVAGNSGGAAPGGAGGGVPQAGAEGGGAAPPAVGGAAPAASGGPPPGTIVNRVHVPGPRQVMLHVKIAELNRTALRQIGVSWLDTRNEAILGSSIGAAGAIGAVSQNSQAASFIPGAFTQGAARAAGIINPLASVFSATGGASSNPNGQLFGVFNAGEFNLFINALRQNQMAKILAEPNLMTLDGQPARFQAGGSFPFPVPQSSAVGGASVAVTIQFRDFGAILQFLPHILANDVIRLDVAPSFSELNPATGVTVLGTTVPGINQREARTVVELREGQTLAIAGLLQTRSNASTSRIPLLGDLPIVGPWFSRTETTTIETELVVMVTPELVAPMEKCDVPPAPGDRVMQPNDFEFYFLGRTEGKTGHPFRATVHHHDPFQVMKHFISEKQWVIGPHGHSD